MRSDKIWVFNVGTNKFEDNPKWLFLYINKYRKDISAFWISNSDILTSNLKKKGYNALNFDDKNSSEILSKAGVFVTNQVKEYIHEDLIGAKYLNLWHGVGTKSIIERNLGIGLLSKRIAKKYIRYNEVFINNQIFLATSPKMEEHFKRNLYLRDDQIARAGYPRNEFSGKISYKSFNHNIKREKGLNSDAKIVLIAPTYRDKSDIDYMGAAFPDMDKLIEKLRKENMLAIFKMHPIIEKSKGFINTRKHYNNCQNLIFWDNNDDIYEILNQVDIAVVDYSSIYYDLLKVDVNRFIRYIFDFDIYEEYTDDYIEMTSGEICNDFDEFLAALSIKEPTDKDITKLNNLSNVFWSYSNDNSYETIIEAVDKFEVSNIKLPILYSFDVFDTIIARKVLKPIGIFYQVQEMIKKSDLVFPKYFLNNYVAARRECESNVREYYRKSTILRESDNIEIKFVEIFDRMKKIFKISDDLTNTLMKWEIECENKNVVPIEETVTLIKSLIDRNEKVILISDMYLPEEEIRKLIAKADLDISKLPLYASSEIGVQKSTGNLYQYIYNNLEYIYKEWIHYGDNVKADGVEARKFGITTKINKAPNFNKFEGGLTTSLKSYDAFLVSRYLNQSRKIWNGSVDEFVMSKFFLLTFPYVKWVIDDAVNKGKDKLYFVVRDGIYLKRIADKIIDIYNYPIKTQLFYGSRKTWRVASIIDDVDKEFFSEFGNFTSVKYSKTLLKSLELEVDEFLKLFPDLKYVLLRKNISKSNLRFVINAAKHSDEYKDILLNKARLKRDILKKYIIQELNFDEDFAFVEYWGRGYNQTCLTSIINNIDGIDKDVEFYYARSIYGDEGKDLRSNYTCNNKSLVGIETVFSEVPFETVAKFKYITEKVVPDIDYKSEVSEIHLSIEKCLDEFCEGFFNLELMNRECTEKEIFDYTLHYVNENNTSAEISDYIGEVIYDAGIWSNSVYEKIQVEVTDEECPKFTMLDIFDRVKGVHFKDKTISSEISLEKSSYYIRRMYDIKKNYMNNKKKKK